MLKKFLKAIVLDCFVLCFVTVANYPIIISLVPLIRYAHHQRLAENWSTHPFHRAKKLMTHHFSVPSTPSYTYGQSLKYIGILNIAVLLYLLNFGNMYLHIWFFRRPCSLVNIYKSRSQEH